MMSPDHLFGILCARPFPGTTDLRMSSGACCFTAEHIALGYTHNGWIAFGRVIPDEMPHPSVIDATQVHAEIRRVLAIVKSEEDRRRDVEAQLAKITDAHAVVSQRLIGAQKEVAEVTTRAEAAEAKVKRLLRQRNAAHAVLDEAGIGLEVEGSPRWTLARRCRAAVEPVWDHLDAVNALDEIAKVVGLIPPSLSSGATDDDVVTRVKVLRQDDDHLLRLLDYHQAPIAFGDRPLTTAERATFVIRRLWQGRANAASEASALRRELSEITDALAHADIPDCAERAPIGQVTEHLSLNAAERIRLAFPKGASDV